MLDAPILKNGEMIGVVCHEHVGSPREWTTEERDFAMSVADAVCARKSNRRSCSSRARRSGTTRNSCPGEIGWRLVGRLAAGVAHDFKNLLSVVMGNAGLIARRPDLPEDVTQRANQIVQAAERGVSLVHELLEFGREQIGHPRVLDVADVAEAFVPLLHSAVTADYPIRFTREPGCGKVLMDRGNLERALLNLVINAWDAMPTGGAIRIHVAPEQMTDGNGPLRRVRPHRRRGFRHRHPAGRAGTNLRPALHDQARRERYRIGLGRRPARCGSGRRVRSRGKFGRLRDDVPTLHPTCHGRL